MASNAGAIIVSHGWEGYAAQRTWTLGIPGLGDWLFYLDEDEVVDPELKASIERFVTNPGQVVGAWVGREFWFLGQRIRHGGYGRTWHLRLLQRKFAYVDFSELDERFGVAGETVRLRGALVHQDQRGLQAWLTRHFSQYAGMATSEPRLYRALPRGWRALAYWVYRYLLRGGFLDGQAGLYFHTLHALAYRLARDGIMQEKWGQGAKR